MKIVHVNSDDLAGGAARAAYRLHRGMKALGVDSHMVVQRRRGSDPAVHGPGDARSGAVRRRMRQALDRLPLRLRHGAVKTAWSTGWLPNHGLRRSLLRLDPDLVILHWGGAGFLPNSLLSSVPFPIFWVLHDMAPFTGGCHYDRGCGRFATGCGCCPLLGSNDPHDISARTLRRKQRHMQTAPHAVVAPTQWMAQQARRSVLFRAHRVHTIHHPHDLERFQPLDQAAARAALGWPQDRSVILFGAVHGGSDPRKGFDLLTAALQDAQLASMDPAPDLRVFGASQGPELSSCHRVHYEGAIDDDAVMAQLYSAADVVVVPSRQEAFGLTASEAHCCGTPVVGFQGTGLADVVDHERTGFLAAFGDSGDLARGIAWVLQDPQRLRRLRAAARERALRLFDLTTQTQAYLRLWESVTDHAVGRRRPASRHLLHPLPASATTR